MPALMLDLIFIGGLLSENCVADTIPPGRQGQSYFYLQHSFCLFRVTRYNIPVNLSGRTTRLNCILYLTKKQLYQSLIRSLYLSGSSFHTCT